MRIYITGMNTVGKSYISKILAEKLNYKFIDPDDIYINKFTNDIENLIKNKKVDLIFKRMSWCLRQIKEENVIIPVNLYLSPQDVSNQKKKDTEYCKKTGIIILVLPSDKIGKSAQIIWNRLKKRDYYSEKYTYMKSFESLKFSLNYMLKISNLLIIDCESPESAANKILLLLKKKGYIK